MPSLAATLKRVARDTRTLYHMVASTSAGSTDAERLAGFYRGQAAGYDRFRARLLHGRDELFALIHPPEGGVWVDMGAGTASNLELLGPRLGHLRRVYVVDLARPLLDVARIRIRERGWPNVDVLEADAASVDLPPASVDVVTFSYSLTMMPAWYAVLEHAYDLLRPGGLIGVVDFYTSRKHPPPGWARHPWRTRVFWTLWFAHANVFLSTDHLPYLRHRFTELHAHETRGRVPYLPGCRAPYYVFVGRRPDA